MIESNLSLSGIADVLFDVRRSWIGIARLLQLPIRGEGGEDPLKIEVLLGNEESLAVKMHVTEVIYRQFVACVRVGFSEESVSRVYMVYELLQFVRRLLLCVMSADALPGEYHVSAWLRFQRTDVRVSAEKMRELSEEFAEHRARCEDSVEFDALMIRVRRVIVNVAFEVLALDGLHDVIGVALSSLCPPVLVGGEEKCLVREIRHALELFLNHGRIMLAEQESMLRGYIRLVRAFRRAAPIVDFHNVVTVLYDLCGDDQDAKCLLDMMFCFCGGGVSLAANVQMDAGELDATFVVNVGQTISSWMQAQNIQSYNSVPDSLLDCVSASLSRNARTVVAAEEEMWDVVGRVATPAQRAELFARMGYTRDGERAGSPELM